MPADPGRVRERLTKYLDAVLEWPRLSGLDSEGKAITRACRSVVASDDAVVAKIAASVGPYDGMEHPYADRYQVWGIEKDEEEQRMLFWFGNLMDAFVAVEKLQGSGAQEIELRIVFA